MSHNGIYYNKPQRPKETILFVDGSTKDIPYEKWSVFMDSKGRVWHSTVSKDVVFSQNKDISFFYDIKKKTRLGKLTKILDYWC